MMKFLSKASRLFFVANFLLHSATHAQSKKVYIDPKAAISTSVGQLFSRIEFIPLETTRESVFNRAANMVVTDEFYIILDRTQSAVLFFDLKGKFLSVFRNRDYDLLDITYLPDHNTVYSQTQKRGYIFTQKQQYGMIGSQKEDFFQTWMCDLEKPGNLRFRVIKGFNYSGYTTCRLSPNDFLASAIFSSKDFADSIAYELKYVRNRAVTAKFFPYNQKSATLYYNQVAHVSFFKSPDSSVYFTRPYRYEIYSFNNGAIDTTYQFVFPAAQSLPPDFFQKDLATETSLEVLRKDHQGAVQNILPVLSWDNHLVFWLSTLQPNNIKDFKQYLLDLNTNTLINARLIAPDSVSYNLPVNFTGLVAQDRRSIYTFMFADELIALAKKQESKYPAALKAFLQKNSPDENPVIVRLIKK